MTGVANGRTCPHQLYIGGGRASGGSELDGNASAGDESPAASLAAIPAADKAAITSVLSAYEAALNASDAEAAGRLYAEDGVLMPPFRQFGKAAVRQSYVAGSKALS
jgi:hypothetical protein